MSKFHVDVKISSFRFFHGGGYSTLIGRFEPCMVGVLLIKVVVGLRPQLLWKLLQHRREQGIDRLLFRGVTMPDRDQMGVESYRQADTAKLVTCASFSSRI